MLKMQKYTIISYQLSMSEVSPLLSTEIPVKGTLETKTLDLPQVDPILINMGSS